MTQSTKTLTQLLDSFRADAKTQHEKGRYFEDLALIYFRQDAKQQSCYGQVWRFGDWAREHGHDPTDTGIDLVAEVRGEPGFCAIQAKFYEPGRPLRKPDIDSFIAAASRVEFTHLAIVDTTAKDYGRPLQNLIDTLEKPFTRIRIGDLQRSSVDWSSIPTAGAIREEDARQRQGKNPLTHQTEAVEAARTGLLNADRGQFVMACGTGKTYTAQLVAEDRECRRVLVLVPSLALVSQTVAEWCQDASAPIRAIAVCSDTQVGRRRMGADDSIQYDIHDLAFPATTDAAKLADRTAADASGQMTAVFATYHSLDVIAKAQDQHGMAAFDLVICDEAHRTTGQIDADREASNFVRVHDSSFLKADKRLYMTATPRIYTDAARTRARERSTTLCTMDDVSMFGEVLFYRGFGWAVQNGLLSDYQVVVLGLDESQVSGHVQQGLASEGELILSDAVKILGSYKALLKQSVDPMEFRDDPEPVQRAMAFSNTIRESKRIRDRFDEVVGEYHLNHPKLKGESAWNCKIQHVDGTTRSTEREAMLRWLSEDTGSDSCHVLSNVRCLGEGVDIPALDAVLFLHPRKSQIDVVQAVGRVMRKAEGKKRGYVILPIGIPAGVPPKQALADNKKYRIIWQIVNALKSHDERLEAQINAGAFGEELPSDKIRITLCDLNEVALAELGTRSERTGGGGDNLPPPEELPVQGMLDLKSEIAEAVYAKIVDRCADRDYWEDWASDVQKIAEDHVTRIRTIVEDPDHPERADVFKTFLAELQDDLNPSVTAEQAVEMLAQHLITRPVFDAVFVDNAFTQRNSVSMAMQRVVELLDAQHIGRESVSLASFYASVRRRAGEVKTAAGKQELIKTLYESFFQKAFRKISSQLGIVYTPVEAVDYVLHAVDGVLKSEFGFGLGKPGVKILDPFAGTGTFIVRAIESGLIKPEDLPYKYRNDLHANEIVPLAYYIAGINIENAFLERCSQKSYEGFDNLCLTDTFQLTEHKGAFSDLFPQNQKRIDRQSELDFLTILGNPPYSAGQRSANENAPNIAYLHLDQRIAETYAQGSNAQLKRYLYNSFVRAIRWASDRIGNRGVVGFVTSAGWLDGAAMAGLRKCLCKEFASLYVLNLRGDQRTSGEISKQEGGKLFGGGSRTPIAITILVKNPASVDQGAVNYYDIGDYLTREDKLEKLKAFAEGKSKIEWQQIQPDEHGDWTNQRDPVFDTFLVLGDKKNKGADTVFRNYSLGLATTRDHWCYNFSRTDLESNVCRSLDFYNSEVERYSASDKRIPARDFVSNDPTVFSWDRNQRNWVGRGIRIDFKAEAVYPSAYRPFLKQWAYFHRSYNNCVYQLPKIFPRNNSENRLICVSGVGARTSSVLMIDMLPDLNMFAAGAQGFPRYVYVTSADGKYEQVSNVSGTALAAFHTAFPGHEDEIDADIIFHYIYGLLHSPDYRQRFGKNLLKQLPRIPFVDAPEDFFAFAEAGEALGELHVNYEDVEPYPALINGKPIAENDFADEDYRVEKMRFAGKRGIDRSTIIYNHRITVSGIPDEAYDYSVNGRTPVEWIIDRQRISTHKASGIVNDANRYATETVGDPAYPLKLLLRAITVGIETARIVKGLPVLKLREE